MERMEMNEAIRVRKRDKEGWEEERNQQPYHLGNLSWTKVGIQAKILFRLGFRKGVGIKSGIF